MKKVSMLALLLLLVTGCCVYCIPTHNEKAVTIAYQMNALAIECQSRSSTEMKEIRIQFLNAHKDATVKQFIDALNTPVNGKKIIPLLRELGGDVCNEYADSVEKDKALGEWAISRYLGGVTIADALRSGLLS
jgi:uncharacterized protein with von Willebrand factor type A (vWA) domain